MNVVVFCSDTFRQDRLGFLGQTEVQTPVLDNLARESALFEDFRLCSFPTVVNRIEVFTGRVTFPRVGWGALPFQYPVLAEVFKHGGFHTGLVSDNPHMMRRGFGFGRGFDQVIHIRGQNDDDFIPAPEPMVELGCPEEKLEARKRRLDRYRRSGYWYRERGTNCAETVARHAMDWLPTAKRPFFLWIDGFDPHEPWDAPERFLKKYPWDSSGEAVFWPADGEADAYSKGDLFNMRSLYQAEVTQADFWLGRIMEQLRSTGLLEDTVIIFCSDHGYYLGEHNRVGKLFKPRTGPNVIYEELARVPLLIRHPSGMGAGQRYPGICQPQDLFPTLLELAGLPQERWTEGKSLCGRLSGKPETELFAAAGCHPNSRNIACTTVWKDGWCLVYSPLNGLKGSELYYLPRDPGQTENVISKHFGAAEELFAQLRSWLASLGISRGAERALLETQPVGWTQRARQKCWSFRNSCSYFLQYRGYTRAK